MALPALTLADWIVLIVYLAVIAFIAVRASKRVKNTASYFMGERRFGRITMIAQSFGTGTHAEMPVSLAGIVYSMGLSGIWFQWKNLFVTPFYWILAPVFRRFRRTTTAEVMEDRYGSWMAAIYTVFALVFFIINFGSMLKGAGKVIGTTAGAHVSVNTIVVLMTCFFIVYSLLGGLLAAAWTEIVQGLLIVILSFMLIPAGWRLVGGFDGMKAVLPASNFSLVTPKGIGAWVIVLLTINGLVGIIAQPHLMATVGSGKDEDSCAVGMFYGNLVKRICTVGWAIVGLLAATMITSGVVGQTSLSDPELAFGFACQHLLFPGGAGLLIACFLAANLASCSAFMVDSGALVTNGFYRRYIRCDGDDAHYLRVGRIAGVIVTALAILYSLFLINRILYTFLLTETLATFVGVSLLGGVVWRRANRWGALASIVVSMSLNFGGYLATGQRLDHWSAGIFGISLLGGIAALIIVSYLTPPESAAQLARFFDNLDRPSTAADTGNERPGGRPLLLVHLLTLRKTAARDGFYRTYAAQIRGFVVGAAMVLTLIALLWIVVRFG